MLNNPPQNALADHLLLLAEIVGGLQAHEFAGTPPGSPLTASIGQHLRHALDHIRALLTGHDTGTVCYDRRERGTSVETNRSECLALLRTLEGRVRALPTTALRDEFKVEQVISAGGAMALTRSNLGRELIFVFHHTVHHDALIAVLLKLWGRDVPEGYGVAPATRAAETTASRIGAKTIPPGDGESSLS